MVRVTKQRVDGVSNRVKQNIKEIREFLEKEKNGQGFFDQATVMKRNLGRNFEELNELIGR